MLFKRISNLQESQLKASLKIVKETKSLSGIVWYNLKTYNIEDKKWRTWSIVKDT